MLWCKVQISEKKKKHRTVKRTWQSTPRCRNSKRTYCSLTKKGPVSNIRQPPIIASISCKGLKFSQKRPPNWASEESFKFNMKVLSSTWYSYTENVILVHIKATLISCFWSGCVGQFSLSYLTYVANSDCNHSVYTTCTQWLHHPSLYILAPWTHKCLHFVVSSQDRQTSPSTIHFAVCTLFSFNFGFQKKPGNYIRMPVLVHICKAIHAWEMQTLNWIKLVLDGCVGVQYPVVGCDSVNMGTLMVKCSNVTNIRPPPCLSTK